ncbi:MAG: GNAT family N-acetyltransferase [Myxococcota bacterium]
MPEDASPLTIQLEEGVSSLPQPEWDALVGNESPFLEWNFLAGLEEAGALGDRTGWDARPLVAREGDRIVAACPLYVKGNSEGEFVFDYSWADAAYRAGIEYYPKLLVGVPFSPVTGARFLVREGEKADDWIRQLGAALRQVCGDNDLSSVHVNFCHPAEAQALEDVGYHTRVGLQYHWHNQDYATFEDYLAAFRSKRRNQVRRERREMEKQGVTIRAYQGDDIDSELVDPMYDFYLQTIRERAWGRQYLNREVFELLLERWKDRLCLIVAEQDGQKIAGTFNVQKGDALYGRYWGATRMVRHLHFNVCYYAAVEHCIDHGLARFEPGAGGEYKQVRGFDASPTYSAHFMADPRLGAAIERFLESERANAEHTIDWYRENSALKSKPADDRQGPG